MELDTPLAVKWVLDHLTLRDRWVGREVVPYAALPPTLIGKLGLGAYLRTPRSGWARWRPNRYLLVLPSILVTCSERSSRPLQRTLMASGVDLISFLCRLFLLPNYLPLLLIHLQLQEFVANSSLVGLVVVIPHWKANLKVCKDKIINQVCTSTSTGQH